MRRLVGLAILFGLVGCSSAALATDRCYSDTYKRADAALVSARADWSSLFRHQKAFGACDDGALAEGYSDAVVTLLARRWEQQFNAFAGLSERRPAFRRWAIRHIDSSASSDDLSKVEHNAARCIGNAKARDLCREIRRAAREALTDLAER